MSEPVQRFFTHPDIYLAAEGFDEGTFVRTEVYRKLEAENATLRAQVERDGKPTSDDEWNPYAWFDDGDDDTVGNMTRPQVDNLIANRKKAKDG